MGRVQNFSGIQITRDFLIDVVLGNVPGASYVQKFGRNAAVTTTIVPICLGGFYRMPTTATTLEVLSDDVADDAAGNGLRKITVQGLDTNYDLTEFDVEMDGTTPVAFSKDLKRLFRIKAKESGTYASQTAFSQAGTLTIRESGGGNTWAVIGEDSANKGLGQSQIGCYTVPRGRTALLMSYVFSIDSNQTCKFFIFQRNNANVESAPYDTFRIVREFDGINEHLDAHSKLPIQIFPEMTDIVFMSKGTSASQVTVDFELLILENGHI